MKTLDIEKILATGIPDIHPAYGGVRGKTMSSRSQDYVFLLRTSAIQTSLMSLGLSSVGFVSINQRDIFFGRKW